MTIGIIGLGLIGGSISLKLKKNSPQTTIVGYDNNELHTDFALTNKMVDDIRTVSEGFHNLDLIIICTPVNVTEDLLPKILDQLQPKQSVMDVGSTKERISERVKFHSNRKQYVAFHPMWGTENNGPESATINSFEGKAAIICDKELSNQDSLDKCLMISEILGLHTIFMSSKDHDLHTAYISHISHITSYALANTVLEKEREEETIFQLASSGFSSTVRLAKSHPEMWVPIFQQNKENVLDVLNEHITQLRKFKSALEKENFELLEELIQNANRIRGILK